MKEIIKKSSLTPKDDEIEKLFQLLREGVSAWNQWRNDNPEYIPDLRKQMITSYTIINSYFAEINMKDARLKLANLSGNNFSKAYFKNADLTATLLNNTNFVKADLSNAKFINANLTGADLHGANLKNAKFENTILNNTNLYKAKNLDSIKHSGPSVIDHRSINMSGDLPEIFLQGCGLPDDLIDFYKRKRKIKYHSCFISYSSYDEKFATEIHKYLQNNNIRCWYAPEDMKIGGKIRNQLEDSIQEFDKLLLILSKNSIKSSWVEKEVETAFEKESVTGRIVLFPITVDTEIFNTPLSWAADIRRTRHIGKFYKDAENIDSQKNLKRLIRDLKRT